MGEAGNPIVGDYLGEVADRLRDAARSMLAKAKALDGEDYRVVRFKTVAPAPWTFDEDEDDEELAPGGDGAGPGTGEGEG